MRHPTLLLLVVALAVVAFAGCGSVETREAPQKTRVTAEVSQDPPPPAWGAGEAPDFADPKPPIAATSRASKESESMRERLLHDDKR